MRTWLPRLISFAALLLIAPALSARGQEPEIDADTGDMPELTLMNAVDWQMGPTVGDMGEQSQIDVPEGYMFLDRDGTRTLMEMFGNLLSDREAGLIAPAPTEEAEILPWFVVFEFDPIGYVKDDEKDDLDADAMLEAMKEGEERSNREREKLGYGTLHTTGWAIPPRYNGETRNLEWAIEFRTMPEDELVVNHNTRFLGRSGVMEVTLVVDPEHLQYTLPTFQACMSGFAYKQGMRYAEYREGDKIAAYGLTGLVLGGGLAVAAKTGLLQKFGKFIIIGLAGIGAWFKKVFGKKETA